MTPASNTPCRCDKCLAAELARALAALIGWADDKHGDDFGTTEWRNARDALAKWTVEQ